MNTFKTLILFCLAFFTVLTGCKKDKKRAPTCKIVTVTAVGETMVINYDDQNRIASIVSGNVTRAYVYTGLTITITQTNAGSFLKRKIVTVGANNMPVNVREERNTTGSVWANDVLEYNGTELLRITTTQSSGAAPIVQTFTWANGNPVANTNASFTSPITVDASKPSQAGDFAWHAGIMNYWVDILKTKNMITAIGSTAITYTFDTNNNISSMISGSIPFNYNYSCN